MNSIKQQLQEFTHNNSIAFIVNDENFYFSILRNNLEKFENIPYSKYRMEIEEVLSNIDNAEFSYQKLLDKYGSSSFYDFLMLIGELISILDEKAYNKNLFNPYSDNRVIAKSNFSQKDWLISFFKYKKENNHYALLTEKGEKAFINSIEYIKKPLEYLAFSSDNRRKMLYDYFKVKSDSELLMLFEDELKICKNSENKSILLTKFLNSKQIQKEWLITVRALLISDGTGWQQEHIKNSKESKFNIIWNSKKPSGTKDTISKLNDRIKDDGFFYLYYSSKGDSKYRAKVIDFAVDPEEYEKKKWSNLGSIYGLEDRFENYIDSNKTASIVFLAEKFEEIDPIPINKFICYKDYKLPTQDNITPISEINFNIVERKSFEMNQKPINQILYGPPGTGKTFSTIDHVVDILEPNNSYLRDEKKAKYDQLIIENRVFFTTFHQSMSYEEFIEGIKPKTFKEQIFYEVTNGILKDISEQCFEDIKALKSLSIAEPSEMSFKEKFQEFGRGIHQGKIELKTRSGITVQISKISNAGNLQLKSGEDTRDYVISKKRLEKLVQAFPNPSDIKNIHDEIRSVIGGCNSSLFFAALEAFVKFDKKITETIQKDGKDISLSDIQLSKEEIESLPPYFLIIDEINRGNVSAIFGELITIIEEDKRFGMKNQLFVTLPYSREAFSLPPNLYIIGTMNTADRSVEALDTALRRRFVFKEMLPDPKELQDKGEDKKGNISSINLPLLLTTINDRIEALVDRDHTIGHAFFMDVDSLDSLRNMFANKVIPLLQEYFYGDYAKMEMVIGPDFFNSDKRKKKVTFAVQNEDVDIPTGNYELMNILDPTFNFVSAINRLLNRKVTEVEVN
jgi:5-methylcytosine-specific restriction protein B